MDRHGEGGEPVATGKTESDRLTYGSYLQQTLDYHFFPELWEARNRLLARPPAP